MRFALAATLLFVASATYAATPSQNCRSAKNMAAGKYDSCRQKAEAKLATTGNDGAYSAALQKCSARFAAKWPLLEQRAADLGDPCPSTGDQSAVQGAIDDYTTNIATALAGGVLQDCPADLMSCQGSLGTCSGSLGTCTGNLATCTSDLGTCNTNLSSTQSGLSTCNSSLSTCNSNLTNTQSSLTTCTGNLATCTNDLGTCDTNLSSTQSSLSTCNSNLTNTQSSLTTCTDDLAGCQADLAACTGGAPSGQRLKTGQTTCYDLQGVVISCSGTGQDGELQKGLARSYTDNGDGTITDNKTGLMWEKLSDDGSIHDKDNTFTWPNAFSFKVATLNGLNFAGYSDWRLPNVNELQSLPNYGALNPAVFSAFNTGCAPSCTVLTCSCTQPNRYWSSSTYQALLSMAWYVNFYAGFVAGDHKTSAYYVRAVRGGS